MSENVQGFGDVYNGEGQIVATKVRYNLTIDAGSAGVGRVTIHQLLLNADMAHPYLAQGPNDKPLTLHLTNGQLFDFIVTRVDRLSGRVDVTPGRIRRKEGGA